MQTLTLLSLWLPLLFASPRAHGRLSVALERDFASMQQSAGLSYEYAQHRYYLSDDLCGGDERSYAGFMTLLDERLRATALSFGDPRVLASEAAIAAELEIVRGYCAKKTPKVGPVIQALHKIGEVSSNGLSQVEDAARGPKPLRPPANVENLYNSQSPGQTAAAR